MDVSARRTRDLWLRRPTAHDLAALVEVEADPRTNTHSPTGPPSPEQVEQRLQEVLEIWGRLGIGYWAVEQEGVVIGIGGLRPAVLHGRDCWNLYYRLRPEAWGRGFATQLAREAVAVAQDRDRALPVVARTRPTNTRAQRVASAAGLARRADLDSDGMVTLATGW